MKKDSLVSEDTLSQYAATLVPQLRAGDVVCLAGPLGAGKTTFLRFLLEHLELDDESNFSSPTFAVLHQYTAKNNLKIYHADLYRLSLFAEVEELDLLSSFQEPKTLSFVEWGDKFSDLKNIFTVVMTFDHVPKSPNSRHISFERLRDPHVS
jgi:tRNA threonylcarbamoyladenosine biosynthesis protein TsaE